ncbi:FAD-binding protein [Thiomicrorhabdus sp.]|uniref:FAD-binding protein n=1 Tax=Thiomicrorhabdus sp. TaxID=2039724 RepID=UPI0029C8580F|nr:FAD-binding protein [Thiomicrorhabdus sp.]
MSIECQHHQPETAQLADQIKQAVADNKLLQIVGNQSKVPLYDDAEPISIADHCGIVDYEPAELVVTVKAGTKLSELQAALAEHNQMLGFEPPEYGDSTIGGTYACALTGPSRPFRGALRDFVLGTKMIDGQGRHLQFGGKMIKNVAGYDVSRMMCGSKGSMALVTELSLKVLPLVEETTYCIEMPEGEAILLMNQMAGTSLPLSGCAYYQGRFYYRVAGEHPEQTNRVEVNACTNDIWKILNPFRPQLEPGVKLWRLDVESTNPAIENTIAVGMGGTRRWIASEKKPKHPYTTLWQSRFAPRHNDTPQVQKIKQGLKKVFDPHHVFKDL